MNNPPRYFFFRDLDPIGGSGQIFTSSVILYHAAGLVDELFCWPDFPSGFPLAAPSGKDLTVSYINPLSGLIIYEWRSIKEIELKEVSEREYEELKKVFSWFEQFNK